MGKSRQKYIHNFARTLMGQLGIKSSSSRGICPENTEKSVRAFVDHLEEQVLKHIGKLSYHVRGHLAACDPESDVALSRAATNAVLAALTRNILSDINKAAAIASRQIDVFRFDIVSVTFRDWVDIEYKLLITNCETEETCGRSFALDKDDPAIIEAGLCRTGGNFAIRNRETAAQAALKAAEVSTYDGGWVCHIVIADQFVAGWNARDGFYS